MKQLKMSKSKLEKILIAYSELVDSIHDEKIRGGFNNLLDKMGDRIFSAPASPKLEYHNCFFGGLS